MLKYLLAFFSGVVTVTGFVVATGASTGSLVVLGFAAATLFYGTLTFAIGLRRFAGFLLWVCREPHRPRQLSRTRTVARQSEVEQEVVSALLHLGANRSAAVKAMSRAALQAPHEFEPLFKTAVGLLRLGRTVASIPSIC